MALSIDIFGNPLYIIIFVILVVLIFFALIKRIMKLVLILAVIIICYVSYLLYTGQKIPKKINELKKPTNGKICQVNKFNRKL
jgi:threonine/homoserine/homoserine lactone efflux protein